MTIFLKEPRLGPEIPPTNFVLPFLSLQDKPSAAPTVIESKMVNATSALIAWTLPLPDDHNGPLLGYQVTAFVLNSQGRIDGFVLSDTRRLTSNLETMSLKAIASWLYLCKSVGADQGNVTREKGCLLLNVFKSQFFP